MNTFRRSLSEDLLQTLADARAERAIIDARTGRVWSYEALSDMIARYRGALHAAGARRGHRVLSVLPNGVEQLASFLATVTAGMDFCPLSPLATVDEARRFVQLCRPWLALAGEATTGAVLAEALSSAGVHRFIQIGIQGMPEEDLPGTRDAAGVAGKLILFTSGTTADPKALVIDCDTLWSSANAWVGVHPGLGHDSRFYNILPMSYLGGLFNLGFIPLAARGSVVVSDAFSGASVLRFWREVQEHGITVLWLSPTMIRSLLMVARPEQRPAHGQIHLGFVGMAISKLEEKQRFEDSFGFPLLENYALSETTFLTTERVGDRVVRRPRSVGSVLPWVDLRVEMDSHGDDAGEIVVRTPFIFDGYLRPSGMIEQLLTPDGWFRTGDLGVVTEGQLVIRGRSREIIKKGGYLVELRELVEVAEDQPAVLEAVAVPMDHDFYGETAILCVRLRPDRVSQPQQALAEVRAGLSERLARFKWPSEIVAVSMLPLTESGKIRRSALQDWVRSRRNVIGALTVR